MCGLVGVAGNILQREHKVFKNLLVMDSLRGPHSTGVFAIPPDYREKGKGVLVKEKGDPFEFFWTKGWQENLGKNLTWKLLLGHNRWATMGEINQQNAHPFHKGHIIGAHNGTLIGQHLLPDHLEYEVDSENIYHAIAKQGIHKTVPQLHGAYALSYYDASNKTLNFLRNKQRTLFHCFDLKHECLFWASEKYMLKAALDRNNVEHTDIVPFEEDVHYKFTVPTASPFRIPAPAEEKMEGYVPVKKSYVYPLRDTTKKKDGSSGLAGRLLSKEHVIRPIREIWTNGGSFIECDVEGFDKDVEARWFMDGNDDPDAILAVERYSVKFQHAQLRNKGAWAKVKKGSAKALPLSEKKYSVYRNEEIDAVEFNKRVKGGCNWCNEPISVADANDIAWFGFNTVLCPSCTEYDETRSLYNH